MYNYEHDYPYEAFITNSGKYSEGELVGEWVKFPTTPETLEAVMERIGIGSTDEFGQPYEEYCIIDYAIHVNGLSPSQFGYNSGEYVNLDELNYLASKIDNMSDSELKQFEAVLEEGLYSEIKDLINLTDNLDAFEVLSDVNNEYNLGYYYIKEAGINDLPKMSNLSDYIDYERFGRDMAVKEGGTFTSRGYVVNHDSIEEIYDGNIENIPGEYIVTNRIYEPAVDLLSDYDIFQSVEDPTRGMGGQHI